MPTCWHFFGNTGDGTKRRSMRSYGPIWRLNPESTGPSASRSNPVMAQSPARRSTPSMAQSPDEIAKDLLIAWLSHNPLTYNRADRAQELGQLIGKMYT